MRDKGLISIGDFAQLSRTTLATLHHYDTVGLLSPVFRGENNYRYYSVGQLAAMNAIRTLQKLQVPLSDIKEIKENRSPKFIEELLEGQIGTIAQKLDYFIHAKKLLFTLLKSIQTGLEVDQENITVQYFPSESIVLGPLNDYSDGKDDYDALFAFYRSMCGRCSELDMNYPVWGLFSAERIKRGDWVWPDRYFFYNPDGPNKKPAALYAVGYIRAGYGCGSALYERMVAYIEQNGFEICGDAYEEYPLNEVCIADDHNYLMRVMITVRQKIK